VSVPEVLLVFVKAPRSGMVKTRLAAAVGDETAAELYRAMADRVRRETAGGPERRVFVFAPEAARPEVEAWLAGETCEPQAAGDLGARMAAAFERAFAGGARRVALIGTDVPDLSRVHVRAALDALEHHDVALGPAADGGYYLIALRRPCPELFHGVAWSTPAVREQTLARASAAGLRVAELAPLSDVDTIGDLRREWLRLRAWLPPALARRLEVEGPPADQ
jgi:rSAM/selenodomain-associated transferase 1